MHTPVCLATHHIMLHCLITHRCNHTSFIAAYTAKVMPCNSSYIIHTAVSCKHTCVGMPYEKGKEQG